MTKYADLYRLPEFDRIRLIGETAEHQIVGVVLEDESEKVARYIQLVTEQFPKVRHIATFPGMVRKTKLVQFGPLARQ